MIVNPPISQTQQNPLNCNRFWCIASYVPNPIISSLAIVSMFTKCPKESVCVPVNNDLVYFSSFIAGIAIINQLFVTFTEKRIKELKRQQSLQLNQIRPGKCEVCLNLTTALILNLSNAALSVVLLSKGDTYCASSGCSQLKNNIIVAPILPISVLNNVIGLLRVVKLITLD